jgi:TonB family protein
MTMNVAKALAGFLMLASVGHAQGTAEQLARCASMPTSATRLKCYDALAKPKPAPTRTASAGAVAETTFVPVSSEVFTEAVVDERPELLSAPQVVYPPLLRQANIEGRVVVQCILDTLGRAEPASVKVTKSPNPGFDQEATAYVLHALFRPARVHGRAVRVLLNIPLDFKIRR